MPQKPRMCNEHNFVEHLISRFPDLKDVKEWGNLLYPEMMDFRLYTQSAIEEGDFDLVRECFMFADWALRHGTDQIRNAVSLSYLHNLELSGTNGLRAKEMMSDALLKEWKIWHDTNVQSKAATRLDLQNLRPFLSRVSDAIEEGFEASHVDMSVQVAESMEINEEMVADFDVQFEGIRKVMEIALYRENSATVSISFSATPKLADRLTQEMEKFFEDRSSSVQ